MGGRVASRAAASAPPSSPSHQPAAAEGANYWLYNAKGPFYMASHCLAPNDECAVCGGGGGLPNRRMVQAAAD